jgi:hypothetical protein
MQLFSSHVEVNLTKNGWRDVMNYIICPMFIIMNTLQEVDTQLGQWVEYVY